jgi:glycosyltransferase involved in cell wall biosynthesis
MNASSRKPKIVISSYDDIKNPYYAGGGAISITEVASRLTGDFDITVLTGNYPGAKNLQLNGVQYRRIGPSFTGAKFTQLLFHFILPYYVHKMEFDLWIENLTPPFSTSCLQAYTRKPVIGLVHMLAAEDMERKYKLPIFRYIENTGLKSYRYFIAPTKVTVAKLSGLSQQPKTFMIPNGVTPQKPSIIHEITEPYIYFIGRLEVNQKGLDLLMHAYSQLPKKQQIKLLITGTGVASEEKKLKDLIRTRHLEDRVQLLGRIEGQRKWDLMKNASLVVVPSRLETFGIVALEAMACSKPIVTFDIPGLEWLPNSCAIKAKPFDSTSLASAMSRILSDTKLEAAMGNAAKQASLAYSWTTIAKEYQTAIENVLAQPASS